MAHVKTAVSLPEELYKRLDAIACERHTSRSKILAEALADYVAHLESEEITRQLHQAFITPTPAELAEDEHFLAAAKRHRRMVAEVTGDGWDASSG